MRSAVAWPLKRPEIWVRVSPPLVGEVALDEVDVGVAGGVAEEVADGAVGVAPELERGLEMSDPASRGAVEERVEQREPDHLGFGSGEERADEPGFAFGEVAVDVVPEFAGGRVASTRPALRRRTRGRRGSGGRGA